MKITNWIRQKCKWVLWISNYVSETLVQYLRNCFPSLIYVSYDTQSPVPPSKSRSTHRKPTTVDRRDCRSFSFYMRKFPGREYRTSQTLCKKRAAKRMLNPNQTIRHITLPSWKLCWHDEWLTAATILWFLPVWRVLNRRSATASSQWKQTGFVGKFRSQIIIKRLLHGRNPSCNMLHNDDLRVCYVRKYSKTSARRGPKDRNTLLKLLANIRLPDKLHKRQANVVSYPIHISHHHAPKHISTNYIFWHSMNMQYVHA